MANYGIHTTAHTGIPDNVDLAALNQFLTRDGVGYGETLGFAAPAARRFGAFDWPGNEEMATIMTYLVSPSPDFAFRWRHGEVEATRLRKDHTGTIDWQRRLIADSQVPEVRVATAMPAYTWETTRGGPQAYSRSEVESDVLRAFEPMALDVWKEAIRAVLTKAGRAVIGSSTGKGVGWIGGTDQDVTKPRKKGVDASSDNHYLTHNDYADSANGRRALFAEMYRLLDVEHSAGAPLLLLHGRATLADVRADTQYAKPTVAGITPGGGSTASVVTDVPTWAHGKLLDSGAWCVDMGSALPDDYYAMVKSYGPLNERNPLRLAYPQDLGFGPILFDQRSWYPVDQNTPQNAELLLNLAFQLIYGVAVKEPAQGVAGLIGGAGTWTEPTI